MRPSPPVPPDLEISVLDQLITIQVLLQTATPADQAAGKIDADQQYTNNHEAADRESLPRIKDS